MIRLALLVAVLAGCATASSWLTVGEAAGRAICGALGCPCAAAHTAATGRVVYVEVRADGTAGDVRALRP